ncbi:hypothetical protein ACG04Q_11935 [Roseateles sp. DXS20W]|uniref:Uncharacterized protein n=1 Tax=Pelomonas lactea TaxID=3299030 RepID=A0ABW7GKF3_9BURK
MSAAVSNLAEERCARHTKSPAKVQFGKPIKATLADLKVAVRWRDDMPNDVPTRRLDEAVGVTALHLGLCALGGGVELDLGNGYILVCTVRKAEDACAG